MSAVATAIVGGALIGGYMQSQGAKAAANTQAQAADAATASQQQMYAQTQANLRPYINAGNTATRNLLTEMPSLTTPFQPTMAQLQGMPGYQFELQQGLESAQNGYAARGLGSSGAAMKGAADYAQGLASNDLNTYSNLYYTGQNNAYNKLLGVANMGESAAAGQGSIGANYANGISNTITGAGNAQAAGQIGSANAYSNALTNGVNNYLQYNLAQNALTNNNLYGMYGGGSAGFMGG